LQLQIGAAIMLSSQAAFRDLFANSCFGLTHHFKKKRNFFVELSENRTFKRSK
jgi:hypothetical protein